ncbi:MAG: hypothetical protein GC203_15840 [Phenylobacterium sp.]|uniref:RcnB family protein n=1 Tax=Phenylobacterium sp. TaxID=1871053 RepID=UPI0025E70612|nr:RcnB family protein [Phenylobacterium sp.]MBI1199332.1 hypothetical protein [Phenylobacterium sp.]
MKIAVTALAFAVLAGATAADAAPGQRGDWSGDRPQRDGSSGRPPPRAPRAAEAPAATSAPQAPPAAEPRGAPSGYRGRNVVVPEARGDRGHDGGRDRDHSGGDRRGGDHGDSYRGPDDRYRYRHDGRDGRDRDRDRDHRDGDRRDGDHRDRDHRDRDHYDRDYRGGGSYWSRGHYPTVYFSPHRYQHRWRPPPGYYVRIWSYGDYLPRGWYGPDWWLIDPWAYDLPPPPPGFDWVRAGDDALLVDRYTGRIIQVVRDVFW